MSSRGRFLVLIGLGASLLGLTAVGAWGLRARDHDTVIWVMLVEGALYILAAAWISFGESPWAHPAQRRSLLLILGVALLARVMLIGAPPVSTDVYRYVWDGRVQAAGMNPYCCAPAAPEVAFLRDEIIYPNINRETAVTVYPPMAQVLFRVIAAFAANITSMKLAMVLFEAALVAAVLTLLRRRKLPETRILLYVWHPLPLFEFAGSGHVDAAALGLMLLACLIAEQRRLLIAGAVLGGAALVKFFPLVVLPAIYRRWDWRLPLGLVVAALALYLPFLGAHGQVLGFLPDYIHEEGLADGRGFFLLEALGAVIALPRWSDALYLLSAAGLLGWLAWRASERSQPAQAMTSGLGLVAVFTLLLSPHLAWYFTWIVPFLCFRLSWPLVYISIVSPLLYRQIWEPSPLALHATLYVPCALLFLVEHLLMRRVESCDMSIGHHAD